MKAKSAASRTVAIYSRVSTGRQTTENQERELQTIADRMGWTVVKVYRDQGISGAKSRKDRPAFDALWKDAARRTEFCGQRLAGDFRCRMRENGRNSVRRPRIASLPTGIARVSLDPETASVCRDCMVFALATFPGSKR